MNIRWVRSLSVMSVAIGLLLGLPAGVAAQPIPPVGPSGVSGLAYGFGSVGGVEGDSTLHVGGGGEAVFGDAVGVGAEIGYLSGFEALGEGLGVFSLNGSYHFLPGRSQRLRPFVTGGYTLGFREGTASLFNVGGGVDYWWRRNAALRVEFRDHVWADETAVHFWGIRAGIVWR